MLAAAPIIPASSMDFPDGAQRFNWCNCQDSVIASRGLSGAAVSPPIFDFNHWNDVLTGGGGATATPEPAGAPGGGATVVQSVSPYLLAAAAGAALLLFFGGKGKR